MMFGKHYDQDALKTRNPDALPCTSGFLKELSSLSY
jgi:hypothetical protein